MEIRDKLVELEMQLHFYEAAYGFPSAVWFAVDANREDLEGMNWSQALDLWAETYRVWLMQLVTYRTAGENQKSEGGA